MYKCNRYNQLSYISVHQLTITSFVLERKKKDEKLTHATLQTIKLKVQRSFH